jgi:hypothetical protein
MPYDLSPKPSASGFDWNTLTDYDERRKKSFHRAARKQLKALAAYCGWAPSSYDLRSNMAGIAVSGDSTLHHEQVYISVSQDRIGGVCGILIRSCKGRNDYSGGTNHFARLDLLDDIPLLADQIIRCVPSLSKGGRA